MIKNIFIIFIINYFYNSQEEKKEEEEKKEFYNFPKPKFLIKIQNKNMISIKNRYKKSQIEKSKLIINAYIGYYFLFKKKISSKEIISLCKYMISNFQSLKILEKTLLVSTLRLAKSHKNLQQLYFINKVFLEFFENSPFLWINFFFICFFEILQLKIDKSDFLIHVRFLYNIIYYLPENNYKKFLFYIINYYLSEHYYSLSVDFFQKRKFGMAINYGKKTLFRYAIHPRASLEAFLLLIEIFCIFKEKILVEKYLNILDEMCLKNKEIEIYKKRILKIINLYNLN